MGGLPDEAQVVCGLPDEAQVVCGLPDEVQDFVVGVVFVFFVLHVVWVLQFF